MNEEDRIYIFEGKKYFWDGEKKRQAKHSDIFVWKGGTVSKWTEHCTSTYAYKILKPIREEKMKYKVN